MKQLDEQANGTIQGRQAITGEVIVCLPWKFKATLEERQKMKMKK